MKFRKNSTREFCVTDALDLGLFVYIKRPFLVLFAFCQKTHSIRNGHRRLQPAVRNFCSVSAVLSEPFKMIL